MPAKKKTGAAKKGAARTGLMSSQLKAKGSQVASFPKLVTELVTAINDRPEDGKIVVARATIEAFTAFAEQSRGKNEVLPDEDVKKIAACLENLGASMCDTLQSDAVAMLVNVALSAGDIVESERILYLLAQSCFTASTNLAKNQELLCNQSLVKTMILQTLLNCLTIGRATLEKRRWIAVLCVQLLRCSANARRFFEISPDGIRAQLGLAMLEERNSILQIILGHLISTAAKECDLTIDQLFPERADRGLYDEFPKITVNDSWMEEFDQYITQTVVAAKLPPSDDGHLLFGSHLTLEPKIDFVRLDERVYIYLESEFLVCMGLGFSKEIQMTQIFEVSINLIESIVILANTKNSKVYVSLAIQKLRNCTLNAKSISFTDVKFMTERKDADDFAIRLHQLRDDLPLLPIVFKDHLFDSDSQTKHRSVSIITERVAASQQQISTHGGENQPEVTRNGVAADELAVTYNNHIATSQDRITTFGGERQPQVAADSVSEDELAGNPTSDDIDFPMLDGLDPSSEVSEKEDDRQSSPGNITGRGQDILENTNTASFETFDEAIGTTPYSSPIGRKENSHKFSTARSQHGQGVRQNNVLDESFSELALQAPSEAQIPETHLGEEQVKKVPTVRLPEFKLPTVKSKAKKPLGRPIISSQSQQNKSQLEVAEKVTQPDSRTSQIASKKLATTTLPKNDASSKSQALDASTKHGVFHIDVNIEDRSTKELPEPMAPLTMASLRPKPAPPVPKTGALQKRPPFAPKKDPFDLVFGDEEEFSLEKKKGKSKAKPKARKSAGDTVQKHTASQANSKQKRKCALTIVGNAPIRRSQRGAAAKAFDQLQGVDASDNELEEFDEVHYVQKSSKPASTVNAIISAKTSQSSQRKIVASPKQESLERKSETNPMSTAQDKVSEKGKVEASKVVIDAEDDAGIPTLVDGYENNANVHQNLRKGANVEILNSSAVVAEANVSKTANEKSTGAVTQHPYASAKVGDAAKLTQHGAQQETILAVKISSHEKTAANSKLATQLVHAFDYDNVGVEQRSAGKIEVESREQNVGGNLQESMDITPEAATPLTQKLSGKSFRDLGSREKQSSDRNTVPVGSELNGTYNQMTGAQRATKTLQGISPNVASNENRVRDRNLANFHAFDQTPTLQSFAPSELNVVKSTQRTSQPEILPRKQQIITFSSHGPQNQGMTSAMKRQLMAPPAAPIFEQLADGAPELPSRLPQADHAPRLQAFGASNVIPISSVARTTSFQEQVEAHAGNNEGPEFDEGIVNIGNDSPPQHKPSPVKPRSMNGSRLSSRLQYQKSSSQLSRVDENGSPQAAKHFPQTDHIGRLQQTFSLELELGSEDRGFQNEMFPRRPSIQQKLRNTTKPAFASGTEFQSKAKPSGPQALVERFVPHTTDRNGSYRSIRSGSVIEADQEESDPFRTKSPRTLPDERSLPDESLIFRKHPIKLTNGGRKAVGGGQHGPANIHRDAFQQRDLNQGIPNKSLMKPSGKPAAQPSIGMDKTETMDDVAIRHIPNMRGNQRSALHDHVRAYFASENVASGNIAVSKMKVSGEEKLKEVNAVEKNLPKKRKTQNPVHSSPGDSSSSDSTVGTSTDASSQASSEDSEVDFLAWNNQTLVSKYETYQECHNEVVRDATLLLSSKEEVIAQLPQRYKDKGARVIVNHERARTAQIDNVYAQLEAKRVSMVDDYRRIDKAITNLTRTSRQCTSGAFEGRWRDEQARVLTSIVATMKLCV